MKYTDYPGIKAYQDILSRCSYDSAHGEFMTSSDLRVINFDKVKTGYLNESELSEEKAHSVDALANGSDQMTYLIEFKNGNVKSERINIHLKIRDSILMLCDICNCSISDTRKDIIFVLVYNRERSKLNQETKRALSFARTSKLPIPFMDLDKLEHYIVRKVLMITGEDFEKNLLPRLIAI